MLVSQGLGHTLVQPFCAPPQAFLKKHRLGCCANQEEQGSLHSLVPTTVSPPPKKNKQPECWMWCLQSQAESSVCRSFSGTG